MKFNVGDAVKAVIDHTPLIKGKTYTITDNSKDDYYTVNGQSISWYYADCFELVQRAEPTQSKYELLVERHTSLINEQEYVADQLKAVEAELDKYGAIESQIAEYQKEIAISLKSIVDLETDIKEIHLTIDKLKEKL